MSAEPTVYLDSSALVKLVVREPESDALFRYLDAVPQRTSCALARVEVVRAVRLHGSSAVDRARRLLGRVSLIRLDDPLLDAAAALNDSGLRSLDAIHVAAAQAIGEDLSAVVTYDRRMAEAAQLLDADVISPS